MKRSSSIGILVLVIAAGWAIAGPGTNPYSHPEVEGAVTADACDVCHKEVTPEVYKDWYSSDHGMMNVKCFVCHGSTGDDFSTKPGADRCVACHADHVESMGAPFMDDKSCFTCHPAHALTSHRQAANDGGDK